jgi:hypothetical protein
MFLPLLDLRLGLVHPAKSMFHLCLGLVHPAKSILDLRLGLEHAAISMSHPYLRSAPNDILVFIGEVDEQIARNVFPRRCTQKNVQL